MRIIPLEGMCLVEVLPEDSRTDSGLHLPEIRDHGSTPETIRKNPPIKGIVREMGAWPRANNGFRHLPEFSVGQTVLISEYSGTKLNRMIGSKLRLVKMKDVLAVLNDQAHL